jgi:hypothetical protein
MKRAPIRDIVTLFLVTRLLLLLVTYFGYILLTAEQYSSAPVDAAFFTSWDHGAASRYLHIAQNGYQTSADTTLFPLFPLLITALAHLLGNGDWSYLLAGMLISNLALLGVLFVLYQLAVENAGEAIAKRTLLYLCIFPTAFIFFTASHEALFLFLVTGVLLALRRQLWWLAGLLGCGAALTDITGILLIVPYLYELWLRREGAKLWLAMPPVVLLPIGTALYSFYCWKVVGDPFAFLVARPLSWPWQGLAQAFVELFWLQPFGSFYQVRVLISLSITLAFLVLTCSGWSRLRISYSLWNILLLLSILLLSGPDQYDPLAASQGVILVMFPAFIMLAQVGERHPRLHQALQIVGVMLLATLSLLFVMNRWVI